MFTSKGCNKRIDRIHERSLNACESSFYDILSTLNEQKILQRCIKVSLTEAYKYVIAFSLELMNEVFYLRQNHFTNLRNLNVFGMNNPSNKFINLVPRATLRKDSEKMRWGRGCKFMSNFTVYRANQLWKTLPSDIKNCPSLQFFMNKFNTLRCGWCQHRICSSYLANGGYF